LVDEAFNYHLHNLKKLHTDLEKQMLKFDEIIPYERQETAKIYSPRLLNMMLACCPQIEAVTKLIAEKCNFTGNVVPKLIQKINNNAVLSKFSIVSIPHQLLFTPFTKELSWWQAYNKLKHELTGKQFKLTYTIVMDAFAALAALHCLAEKLNECFDKDIPIVLDSEHWMNEERLLRVATLSKDGRNKTPFWHTLLFEIRAIYIHGNQKRADS
jgi:hypothetical protein